MASASGWQGTGIKSSGLEDTGLLKDAASYLGERQTMFARTRKP